MTIGYIGLGAMGGALARRLLLRHGLHVQDIDGAAARRLSNVGATPCTTAAEVGAACETILLCLPTSAEVRTTLLGADGIAATARPGTLVVDQTSGDPQATRAMAAELAAAGIELIDAPVSGGPQGAEAGTIAIMVGASDAQFARIRPILAAISPNIFHAGGLGCGQVIKAANNMISAGQRLLSLEAMALAVKNGVDPGRATEIILASSGRNFWLEHFMRAQILSGNLAGGFPLGLVHKDLALATGMGLASGVPLLVGNLLREVYQLAISQYGAQGDINSLALMIDRLAGTDMVPAAAKPT